MAWEPAKKLIATNQDLHKFWRSKAYHELLGYVESLCNACQGVKVSDPCRESDTVQALLRALQTMEAWIDEYPPVQQKQRFGNTAFRDWHARVQSESQSIIRGLLPEGQKEAAVEVEPYFLDSFGNATRIDYGTGHEAHFACFLLCLHKLGAFSDVDRTALVTRVFRQYLRLMRRLLTTYWLEPAGSHGVWGLDDHNFLPFIFGSAQLIGHKFIRPKSSVNPEVLEGYAGEYLYLGCVLFASQLKTGPLQETSPMLCDVASLSTWQRVCSGLYRMYKGEVLGKFPIMQHFLFGSLLPMEPADDDYEESAGGEPQASGSGEEAKE